jgi:hypothetical protein
MWQYNGVNDYSSGNHQLMDKESRRGGLFRRELPAHGQGIHRGRLIPPGITSSWMRNPSKEFLFRRMWQLNSIKIIPPGITSSLKRKLSYEQYSKGN